MKIEMKFSFNITKTKTPESEKDLKVEDPKLSAVSSVTEIPWNPIREPDPVWPTFKTKIGFALPTASKKDN